jgi:hypothetical protein
MTHSPVGLVNGGPAAGGHATRVGLLGPSIHRVAHWVAGETYAGFRALLAVLVATFAIVSVPVAIWCAAFGSADVDGAPAELPPPPEQADIAEVNAMSETRVRGFILGLSFLLVVRCQGSTVIRTDPVPPGSDRRESVVVPTLKPVTLRKV